MKTNKIYKKAIVGLALTVTSALCALLGIIGMSVKPVSAAESEMRISSYDFESVEADGNVGYYSVPSFYIQCSSDYYAQRGTGDWVVTKTSTGHSQMGGSFTYDSERQRTTKEIYVIRSADFNGYTDVTAYTQADFNAKFAYVAPGLTADNWVYWRDCKADNATEYYYFLALAETVETQTRKSTGVAWATSATTVTLKSKSSNYIHTSNAAEAEKLLKSGKYDEEDEALKKYLSIAGLSAVNDEFTVTLKYRKLESNGLDIGGYVQESYKLNSLRCLSESYAWKNVLKMSGKTALTDFNVIRREYGYNTSDLSSGFVTADFTLLQANGYTYEYDRATDTGVITVNYNDFAAKDFFIMLKANTASKTVIFLRSSNISSTADGKTKITFDTSDLQTRLVNNFNWNITNANFNDYVITNPYEATGEVKITKVTATGANDNEYVTAITVETSDEKLLADCGITLDLQVAEPVELNVTLYYTEITSDGNGEFRKTDKNKALETAIRSDKFAKLTLPDVLNGNADLGVNAQSSIINTAVTPAELAGIEYAKASGIKLDYNYDTKTGSITVVYSYNTIFSVYDGITKAYAFIAASPVKLDYKGSELIAAHSGYRVSKVTARYDYLCKIVQSENADDWNNAKITIERSLSEGNVIPLIVEYTDEWKVRVEYLEDFVYNKKGVAGKAHSGFAVKKSKTAAVKLDKFADIHEPTEAEILNFLEKRSLTVIGTIGAYKGCNVVFDGVSLYTVTVKYDTAYLKIIQSDGTYDFLCNIPLTPFGAWADGYGKEWTFPVLNTAENVVFTNENTRELERNDLYGYFYVSVFKERVSNLDSLFAGYTAAGCRTFFSSKEVKGSEIYKFCDGLGLTGTILTLGVNKAVQIVGEALNEDYGTYYSYFSFIDGSSDLNYAANNKADDYFDNSSAADNTIDDIAESISEFFKNSPAIKVLFMIVGALAVLFVVFIVVVPLFKVVFKMGKKTAKRAGEQNKNKGKRK